MNNSSPVSFGYADQTGGLHVLTDPALDFIFWQPERAGTSSAWWTHVPFAHWVIGAARPKLLVELGTYAGVSYTAFCQAVVQHRMNTRCYAVDTWRGDAHAGSYGEEVFEEFRNFHDERYRGFSTLLRSTFDEALPQFDDGTIDVLHIDGFHTYEAVRHDFESWKPKLSERAVVLFHDTNEYNTDFGVWRFWAELREQFPHFEFQHGHGLGVLAVGRNVEPAIRKLCCLSEASVISAVRGRFEALGEQCNRLTSEQAAGQDLNLRITQLAAELEQQTAKTLLAEKAWQEAELSAKAAEARAQEHERAREQIARRMKIARQDVHEANSRLDQVMREHNLIMQSTFWQMTGPARSLASHIPPKVRRFLRRGGKVGWWALTLQLPRKMRERKISEDNQ